MIALSFIGENKYKWRLRLKNTTALCTVFAQYTGQRNRKEK